MNGDPISNFLVDLGVDPFAFVVSLALAIVITSALWVVVDDTPRGAR